MAHRDRRIQSLHHQRNNSDGSSDSEARIDCLQIPRCQQADPQQEWLTQALKSMDPNHRRWLCAFWIDGLSLTEIACKEHIDQQMLRRELKGVLNSLRAEAGQIFNPTHPKAKRQQWPGLQPRRSGGH